MTDATVPPASRCVAQRSDGEACSGRPVQGTDRCFAHHPEAREWRRKGGRRSSNAARAASRLSPDLAAVSRMLFDTLGEVHDGTLGPRQATAMSTVSAALIRVIEHGLFEERVRRLEEAAGVAE